MSLIEDLGTGVEATETFVKLVQELNGSRSAVLQVDNHTSTELILVAHHHQHGTFQEPPQFVIPPGKADVFSTRDKAFSVGTGTEGHAIYAGPGFHLTVRWNVPFMGENGCDAVLADDVPGRYSARGLGGGGNTKVHMRYEVKPQFIEVNSIAEKVAQLRAAGWNLGAETTPETRSADGYGRFQHFQNVSVFWSPSTGAHEVHGAILAKHRALGGERYGYPFTDELTCSDGVGKVSHFHRVVPNGAGPLPVVLRGSIYWHPSLHPTNPMLAAHEVRGAIRAKWVELNAERGSLGYPVTDEMDWGGAAGGRTNEFQGGTVVWDHATGARVKPI